MTEDMRLLIQVSAPTLAVIVSAVITRWLDERSYKVIDGKLKILLNGQALKLQLEAEQIARKRLGAV